MQEEARNEEAPALDSPSGSSTLDEARAWLRGRARAGARCPCCRQYTKVYKRRLGSHMARWLIWLVQTWKLRATESDPNPWIDIKDSPVRGGDYAKTEKWGLIEHKPQEAGDSERRHSALWRPTPAGVDFVYGRIRVPSHVYLYDGELLRPRDGEIREIAIHEAIGKRFDYGELMAARVNVEAPL